MQRYNQTQFSIQRERASLRPLPAANRDLYFFRIVKEQYSRSTRRAECSELRTARAAFSSQRRARVTGGGERDRTDDLLLAKQALSQLSYTPKNWWVWLDLNQRPHAYQACALTS